MIAYLVRRGDIEREDRREMVIYVESAYPLKRTDHETGRTNVIGYELRTTEFGHVRVSSSVYHGLMPNRRVLVVASTVYGLKIDRVIRTARDGEDFGA